MAEYDLGSIGWSVENKGTTEALDGLRKMGAELLATEKDALSYARTILRVDKAMRDIRKAIDLSNAGHVAEQKAVKRSVEDYNKWLTAQKRRLDMMKASQSIADRQAGVYDKETQAIIRQRDAVDKLSEANARKSQSNINASFGIGTNAVNNGAGFGAIESEAERLRLKYNQIYAASNLYENSLRELNNAHNLSVISSRQHTAAVDALNLEYQQFAAGSATVSNRFVQNSQQVSRGMGNMGMVMQQTGYQVGDFLVQIQSGTNVMVAFGQQATQLAGLMTVFGGKWLGIGVALSIVIPLLTAVGALWMRSTEGAEKATNKAEDYGTVLDSLKAKIKELNTESLKIKFGTDDSDTAVAQQTMEDQVKLIEKKKQELKDYFQSIVSMGNQSSGSGGLATLGIAMTIYFKDGEKEKIEAELKALQDTFQKMQGMQVVDDMRKARLEEEAALLDRQVQSHQMINSLINISGGLFATQILAAHAKQLEYMGKTLAESNALEQAMKDIVAAGATDDAGLFADAMQRALDNGVAFSTLDLSSIVATAAANGWSLAASLSAAWSAATRGATVPSNVPFIPSSGLGMAPIVSPQAPRTSIRPERASGIDFGVPDVAGGSGGGGGGGGSDPVADLEKQIKLAGELIGKTEAQKQIINALGIEWRSYSPDVIKGLEDQINAQTKLNDKIEEQQGIADAIETAMNDSIMSAVTGTASIEEAFRGMAYNIIEELYKVLVVQKLVGSFDSASGTGTGLMGLLTGVFAGRASGGTVLSGKPYLVGEKGPELIIPKSSGTVATAQQTAGMVGGSGGVTVNNVISVTGSDSAAVRREIAKMVPQITEATKAAIIDGKRRGGQMGSAFR